MQPQQQWPGRPSNAQIRRARSLLIAALLLATVTQLLMVQWAGGAVTPQEQDEVLVTVRMRETAILPQASAVLSDVCVLEWIAGEPKAATSHSVGQSPLELQKSADGQFLVSVGQVLAALDQAGIHPAAIRIEGAIRCRLTVTGSENAPPPAASDEAALLEWAGLAAEEPPALPAPQPEAVSADFAGRHNTLGEGLRRDLARRLGLLPHQIHLRFAPEALPLARRTDIDAQRLRPLEADDLGPVSWAVVIGSAEQTIQAQASATVTRLVAARPLAAGHVIGRDDLAGQPVRIDLLAERGLTAEEIIGQEAALPLAPGDLLSPDRLAPHLLVRRGQLLTVLRMRNGIDMRLLAVALQDGVQGQNIAARCETTGDTIQVTMIRAQVGRHEQSGELAGSDGSPIPD